MAKGSPKDLVVGLDVGTSKVAAVVGTFTADRQLEIVGLGVHESRGLKKGVVVDIEATTQSIRRAVEAAELMSGCRIQSVYAGISGSHVEGVTSKGIAAVRSREVTDADKERVIDGARARRFADDKLVLHVIPQDWSVDGQEGIKEPNGMSGVRLEANVHLVAVAKSAAQNITKCIERCGLRVDKLIVEPLASSYAVLTADERELGACLVDIGGGTTDLAVFKEGSIRYTAAIPVAGDQVTRDVAYGLSTPLPKAEEIKIKYGCALPQLVKQDQEIEVPGAGDQPPRKASRRALTDIIYHRYRELFEELVLNKLYQSGYYKSLAGGVVLTGGSSKIEGLVQLAEEVLQRPVRLGMPQNITGLTDVRNPVFATGVGLLLFAKQDLPPQRAADGNLGQWAERLGAWFKGHF